MTKSVVVDQLAIITAFETQVSTLIERLTREGFYVTQVNTSGGLLYEARISLLVGLSHGRLPDLLTHLREDCETQVRFVSTAGEGFVLASQPMMLEAEVGGAMVYVLDVEHFEQL